MFPAVELALALWYFQQSPMLSITLEWSLRALQFAIVVALQDWRLLGVSPSRDRANAHQHAGARTHEIYSPFDSTTHTTHKATVVYT